MNRPRRVASPPTTQYIITRFCEGSEDRGGSLSVLSNPAGPERDGRGTIHDLVSRLRKGAGGGDPDGDGPCPVCRGASTVAERIVGGERGGGANSSMVQRISDHRHTGPALYRVRLPCPGSPPRSAGHPEMSLRSSVERRGLRWLVRPGCTGGFTDRASEPRSSSSRRRGGRHDFRHGGRGPGARAVDAK